MLHLKPDGGWFDDPITFCTFHFVQDGGGAFAGLEIRDLTQGRAAG